MERFWQQNRQLRLKNNSNSCVCFENTHRQSVCACVCVISFQLYHRILISFDQSLRCKINYNRSKLITTTSDLDNL